MAEEVKAEEVKTEQPIGQQPFFWGDEEDDGMFSIILCSGNSKLATRGRGLTSFVRCFTLVCSRIYTCMVQIS